MKRTRIFSVALAASLAAAGALAVTNPHGRTTGTGNSPKAVAAFCNGCDPDFAPVWIPSLGPYDSLAEVFAAGDPFLLLRGVFRAQLRSEGRSSDALAGRSNFLRAMAR